MVRNKLNSRKILKEIENNSKDICKYGVRKIGLFGSFLKDESKRGSDIDILVTIDEVNFKNYINTNSISKRKELRGRECSNLHVPVLKKILYELGESVSKMKIPNIKIPEASRKKMLRPKTCLHIEFLMRILNKNTKDVWFYTGFFSHDDHE